MALKVWLPLNGDLTNQGLSDINASGSLIYSDSGKIGKCANVDSRHVLTIPYSSGAAYDFSFSFWIKIPTAMNSNTSWEQMLGFSAINAANSTTVNTINMQFAPYHQVKIYDDANHQHSWRTPTYDVWEHWSIVHHSTTSSSNIKLYINGILNSSYDTSHPLILQNGNILTGHGVSVGSFALNDFRIYDHCLSPKEVKELSKGLILHYRLAGPGQTNLTKGNNTYERNSASTDGWFWFSGSNFSCKPSTTYTLSIDIDGTISNFHGGSASTDPTKRWASMWFYLCKTGTSTNAANGGYDVPINLNSTNYNFRKIGSTRYAWTYTTPSDARSLSIRGNTYSNGTDSIKVKFWNPKIEEGSIATPWCPNPADALYSAMGYNNNIEDDCSGFKNNGTKNGTIIWDANSPRYITSYKFNTGIDYIKSALTLSMPELSCSFWVKPNSSNGGYSILASNYNNPSSGFWLAINTEGSGVWFYNGSYVAGRSLLTNNVWYHCVFTFKNGVGTWYVNGTSVVSTNISSRGTSLNINNLTVGNSYTGTSWNTKNYGNVSDFRVYATALSAADILELYEASGVIDSHYNSYTYEYITDDSNEYLNSQGIGGISDLEETDENTKWLSTGKIESNNFYEI